MSEVVDLVEAVRREHRSILALLDRLDDRYERWPLHEHSLRKTVAHLVAAESRHEAAEIRYLWPVVRDTLPQYAEIRAVAQTQERDARRRLHALSRSLRSPSLPEGIPAASKALRMHIGLEESQILPSLQSSLDPDDSIRIGRLFAAASAAGPTRPHPKLPAVPGLVAAASPIAARLDRIRDLLRIR